MCKHALVKSELLFVLHTHRSTPEWTAPFENSELTRGVDTTAATAGLWAGVDALDGRFALRTTTIDLCRHRDNTVSSFHSHRSRSKSSAAGTRRCFARDVLARCRCRVPRTAARS